MKHNISAKRVSKAAFFVQVFCRVWFFWSLGLTILSNTLSPLLISECVANIGYWFSSGHIARMLTMSHLSGEITEWEDQTAPRWGGGLLKGDKTTAGKHPTSTRLLWHLIAKKSPQANICHAMLLVLNVPRDKCRGPILEKNKEQLEKQQNKSWCCV